MKVHEREIFEKYFKQITHGRKRFGIQLEESTKYKIGDRIVLAEITKWMISNNGNNGNNGKTGRWHVVKIIFIHRGFGLEDGYAALGFELIESCLKRTT